MKDIYFEYKHRALNIKCKSFYLFFFVDPDNSLCLCSRIDCGIDVDNYGRMKIDGVDIL